MRKDRSPVTSRAQPPARALQYQKPALEIPRAVGTAITNSILREKRVALASELIVEARRRIESGTATQSAICATRCILIYVNWGYVNWPGYP